MAADIQAIIRNTVASKINAMTLDKQGTERTDFWSTHYHQGIAGEGEEAAEDLRATLNEDPATLEQLATELTGEHASTAITEVEADVADTYAHTNPEYVIAIADNFIGGPAYQALRHAHRENTQVAETFVALHSTADSPKPILTRAVAMASAEGVRKGAEHAIDRIRRTEFEAYGMGNPDHVNMSGATAYIGGEINQLDNDDTRNAFIVDVAKTLAKAEAPQYFQ